MKTILTSAVTTLIVLLAVFHPLFLIPITYCLIGLMFAQSQEKIMGFDFADYLLMFFLWPIFLASWRELSNPEKEVVFKVIPGYEFSFHKPITFKKLDNEQE